MSNEYDFTIETTGDLHAVTQGDTITLRFEQHDQPMVMMLSKGFEQIQDGSQVDIYENAEIEVKVRYNEKQDTKTFE